MDSVGAKRWLQRAYYLDMEINALIAAKERAMADACRVTPVITNSKVQTARANRQEAALIRVADFSAMIDAKIDALYAVKTEIQQAIAQVEDSRLRAVLVERHINFKKWGQIINDLHCDSRWVFRVYKQAVAEMEKIIRH